MRGKGRRWSALEPGQASPQRLAVNGHHFPLGQFAYLAHPSHEAGAELLRVQEAEDAGQRCRGKVGCPAVSRTGANQSCLALPNSSISTQLSAPKTTAQRDDDDVQESMTLGPVDSRVLEVSKVPPPAVPVHSLRPSHTSRPLPSNGLNSVLMLCIKSDCPRGA